MSVTITGPTPAVVSLPTVTQTSIVISVVTIDAFGRLVVQYGQGRFVNTPLPNNLLNSIVALIQSAVETDQGWAPGSSSVVVKAGV